MRRTDRERERKRERGRERDGLHAVQLPQGDTDAKIAVVPLEGAGSSFLFFRGKRLAQDEFKCLFGPFPTILAQLKISPSPKIRVRLGRDFLY